MASFLEQLGLLETIPTEPLTPFCNNNSSLQNPNNKTAHHLLSRRTVVLNLENTNKETARRLIDFLSGVAYSIDGSLKKIASNAYVITPSNVDVGDAKLTSRKAPAQPEQRQDSVSDDFGEY